MKADTILQLSVVGGDNFAFSRFEIPEHIAFGGHQRLAVHEMVGGRRVVDAMGSSDMPLVWSGLFEGQTALSRARWLDNLRKSGKQAVVNWSELFYMVVVDEFVADFERFYRIPYHISMTVVQDLAQPVTAIASPGIDELIAADNSSAQGLGAQIGDGQLSTLLGSMDKAIKAVGSIAKATQAGVASVLGPVQAVQKRVQVLIGTVGKAANVATFGGVLPGNSVSQAASKLNSQIASATQLPALYNLNAVSGRMSKNLSR